MSEFKDYAGHYENFRLNRDENGVLTIRLHSDDGPFIFNETAHHDFADVFTQVARDTGNRVVIFTGTGDSFCAKFDHGSFHKILKDDVHDGWRRIQSDGARMLTSFLDIEVPVIAAINGPALAHSELPLLADVVLAADHTSFQDATHFIAGLPPGDGMHIVWTALLGLNRGRYFLLTGERLDAAEAQRLGVVGEVSPADQLMPRAYDLATRWAKYSLPMLRATRRTLTLEWQRLISANLDHGLSSEGLLLLARPNTPPAKPIRDLLA